VRTQDLCYGQIRAHCTAADSRSFGPETKRRTSPLRTNGRCNFYSVRFEKKGDRHFWKKATGAQWYILWVHSTPLHVTGARFIFGISQKHVGCVLFFRRGCWVLKIVRCCLFDAHEQRGLHCTWKEEEKGARGKRDSCDDERMVSFFKSGNGY
jgi:hypothetical protein